jgi:hypothetical protein
MKETNPLEAQLRSWQPRRPSARLKHRLFGISLAPRASWFIGPLAPAVVCAVLTMAVCSSRNGLPVVTHLPGPLLASNVDDSAFMDGFANKQNCWSSVTFDSTNHSGLGSIMDSFRH